MVSNPGSFSAEPFGCLPEGGIVWKIRMQESDGLAVEILTLGATIHRLLVPTETGAVDVILGKQSLEDYLRNGLCNSSVIGRCANRIAGGSFLLNGEQIRLEQNLGGHCIHGGSGCYASKNFNFSVIREEEALRLHLTLLDAGAGGFPGQLFFSVDYVLSRDTLRIEYAAVPTQDTPWNVTSHAYFDLNGQGSREAMEQTLQIHADKVLYTTADGIPLPVPVQTEGTVFDFRSPRLLREVYAAEDPQLRQQGGYDHNFCLNGSGFRQAAVLHGCHSHITMEVWTDQPGLQLFTLNQVPRALAGKAGKEYTAYAAVCLETQQYPNAINEPTFPSPVIRAGKKSTSVTALQFYEKEDGEKLRAE